jgi:ketosteroid isomerase-like protein
MSGLPEPHLPADDADFDALMQAHLARVFAERDASRRLAALQELYAEDATLFEPRTSVTGRQAISDAVDALQASMPPDFTFTPAGPAIGHHGLARLHWRAGPPGGPAAVTGTDVARVEGGRIKALHVFLDPQPA